MNKKLICDIVLNPNFYKKVKPYRFNSCNTCYHVQLHKETPACKIECNFHPNCACVSYKNIEKELNLIKEVVVNL